MAQYGACSTMRHSVHVQKHKSVTLRSKDSILQILNAHPICALAAVITVLCELPTIKRTVQVTPTNWLYRTKTGPTWQQLNVPSELSVGPFYETFCRLCMRFARCSSFSIALTTGDCRLKRIMFVEGGVDVAHMADGLNEGHSIHNLVEPVCWIRVWRTCRFVFSWKYSSFVTSLLAAIKFDWVV